ncbi:MAG: flagellar filament capping protein FliD [Ignavibacteriales bacterium]|nr:flagellar filament capping protein FliD [Ignavibacteriales bacterium]
MASNFLTSSVIDTLVNNYQAMEVNRRIDPLSTRKTKYQNLSTAYSTLNTKLSDLKTILSELKNTDSSSVFANKSASSSNANFISVTASGTTAASSYSLRVNQMAKNDLVIGSKMNSTDYSSIITTEGSRSFAIKTGDGSGGEFTSNVDVDFISSDFDTNGITNEDVMAKIQNAINLDKAVITSNAKSGAGVYSGGASSFKINLNGTETTISIASATDYNDLVNQLITSINTNISGITAEKVVDSPSAGDVKLKLTVKDQSKYISISTVSGFDLVSDLNISATKEKAASGIVTASVFTPVTSKTQLSLTAKESGNDFRITNLSETGGTNLALSSIGLNLGGTRTTFVQNTGGDDTPGFIYGTSVLNAMVEFNGLNIERNSNSITDLVSGATVNLKSVMQPTDTTVAVSFAVDTASIKSKIESFINKFNDIYTYIKTNSSAKTNGDRGLLLGDSNASSILSTLNNLAVTSVGGISASEINNLSKLGITFNSTSGLTISDSTQLENAVRDNTNQVATLFTSSNGIAAALYDRVNLYVGTNGYLTRAKSSVDKSAVYLNDSITASQKRIDKSVESLRNQYQQMQMQVQLIVNMQTMMFGG